MIHYRFSVKEVAEFCWRQGDYRYPEQPLKPTAKQGQASHQLLQAQQKERDARYQSEVAVSHESVHDRCHDPYTLALRGRMDALLITDSDLLVEEIKTTYYNEAELPDDQFQVHLAQARLYAAMLLADEAFQASEQITEQTLTSPDIQLRITYWDLAGEYAYEKCCAESADSLQQFLQETVTRFTAWLDRVHDHRIARQRYLSALQFPFTDYRQGQRTLAGACYHQAKASSSLLIHAATGIGKSVSTLFGSLKAMAEQHGEQVWYLTAKTSGQAAALQAAKQLQQTGMPASDTESPRAALKCLTVSSRQRTCFCEPTEDIGNSLCAWEIGFYDRKQAAMEAAYAEDCIDLPCLQRIAQQHRVCPYHLCEELLPWMDVVIADFNYVFSLTARNAHYLEGRMRTINLLVDEAHNLPGRCRENYQASLSQNTLSELAQALKGHPAARSLRARIRELIRELQRSEADAEQTPTDLFTALQRTKEQLDLPDLAQAELFTDDTILASKITINQWLRLEKYCESGLGEQRGQPFSLKKTDGTLTLECNNPAVVMDDLSSSFRSRVFFSGSLLPTEHFAAQCFSAATSDREPPVQHLVLESPFPREHLQILLGPLSMGYHEREASLPLALDYIRALYRQQPGLYLICAPSYGMLAQLKELMQQQDWDMPVLFQAVSGTPESDSHEALTGMREGLAFVVMGGSFAEGVEWPPGVLKGVVILGNGMPGPSPEQKRLQRYYGQAFRDAGASGSNPGFDHAFLFPGLNRVIQTAGRIQRTSHDAGVVLLLDRRFRQTMYQRYLPSHWRYQQVNSCAELAAACSAFWQQTNAALKPA